VLTYVCVILIDFQAHRDDFIQSILISVKNLNSNLLHLHQVLNHRHSFWIFRNYSLIDSTFPLAQSMSVQRSTLFISRNKYGPTYLITYLVSCLLTYLLTYLLTPCSIALLEKLAGSQLVKKFPALYGTRKFITAFTNARHLCLS